MAQLLYPVLYAKAATAGGWQHGTAYFCQLKVWVFQHQSFERKWLWHG